jgi:hypothetical protein
MHRADYPGDRNRFDLVADASEAWARSRAHRAAWANLPRHDGFNSARSCSFRLLDRTVASLAPTVAIHRLARPLDSRVR